MNKLQEIISGIELDAAWGRVREVEAERERVIVAHKALQVRYDRLSYQRSVTVSGIGNILAKLTPDTPAMCVLLDELVRLRNEAYDNE